MLCALNVSPIVVPSTARQGAMDHLKETIDTLNEVVGRWYVKLVPHVFFFAFASVPVHRVMCAFFLFFKGPLL